MTNIELIKELQKSVDKYGELPIQIIYEDVNLIGEDIRVELDRSCSKNSKAISIYTDYDYDNKRSKGDVTYYAGSCRR